MLSCQRKPNFTQIYYNLAENAKKQIWGLKKFAVKQKNLPGFRQVFKKNKLWRFYSSSFFMMSFGTASL
jgi:hypothetical protein